MEYIQTTLFWVALFTLVTVTSGSRGACYQFTGKGMFEFRDSIPIDTGAYFKLKFKTISNKGVIYYAEGEYNPRRVFDFEGLFLRDGYLHYYLFNPGEYSIGSSYGFHGKSTATLNDGYWHTVEFYRNREMQTINEDGSRQRVVYQTGLAVNGTVVAEDNRLRQGVKISEPIILGGDPHGEERGTSTWGFKGKIRDFQEVSRNHHFDQPSSQTEEVSHCNIEEPVAA